MSRHNKKKQVRHSMDLNEISILATVRPATPLFHRTLRKSVQDARAFLGIIPMSMGRIHFIQNHVIELKSMMSSTLSTPLRLRKQSMHPSVDSPYRPPSHLRRRIVARSPFPCKADSKNFSPPETPTRRTPTPALRNFKLPKGLIEEYEGDYANGLCHGEGKALFSNGDTYEGQWYEGKKQGIGTYFYNYFSATYHGDFYNDEKNGFGVIKFSNGDEIEGFWENGNVHGESTVMNFANGCSYQGNTSKGLRSGKGKMKYYEGAEYVGQWKDDSREGIGYLTFKELWFFEGFFHNDSTEGPGILVHKHIDIKEDIKFNSKKAFHPIIPFLNLLQDFKEFLKRPHFVNDTFIFTVQNGIFKGGKING